MDTVFFPVVLVKMVSDVSPSKPVHFVREEYSLFTVFLFDMLVWVGERGVLMT